MSRFTKSMKGAAADFAKAQKNAGRRGEGQRGAPPGSYQMEVKEAFCEASGKGKLKGRPHAVFSFEVAAGRLQGTKHRKLQLLDTKGKDGSDVGLSILLGDLEIMNIKCGGIDELEDCIGDAVGAVVEVSVQKNGQYTNTYINNLIQGGDQDADEEDEDEPEEEEEEEEEEETKDDTELEDEEEETEEPAKKKRGRPKGSKNKAKTAAAPKKKGKKKKKDVDEDEEFDEDIFD